MEYKFFLVKIRSGVSRSSQMVGQMVVEGNSLQVALEKAMREISETEYVHSIEFVPPAIAKFLRMKLVS